MLTAVDEKAIREIFVGEPRILDEIVSGERRYLNEISILLEELSQYKKLKAQLSTLQTKYAALNAEMYDLYMAVHGNAIVISATLAEHNLRGENIPEVVERDAKIILDEFLIFKGFR